MGGGGGGEIASSGQTKHFRNHIYSNFFQFKHKKPAPGVRFAILESACIDFVGFKEAYTGRTIHKSSRKQLHNPVT